MANVQFGSLQTWIDERMKWDPEDFNGLTVFRVASIKLWLPDIVLYNSVDDHTNTFMHCNVMIFHDGIVSWSPPVKLRSSCKIDITYFPFDSQRCRQKFGSWMYDQAQVDMLNKSSVVDISNYITNGEWTLSKYDVERHENIYSISDAVYPDVTIIIVIYRRVLYYVLNILLPCFWLNILSVLTFCLPPDAGEKLTLSISVLLSYSIFMLLVADTMPPTSESVPLIELYLTMSMAMSSISVITTVLVLKIHHSSPNATEVPSCVRFLVLGVLSRIIICESRKKQKSTTPANVNNSQPLTDYVATEAHCVDSNGNDGSSRCSSSNQDSDHTSSVYEKTLASMDELLKYLKLIVQKSDEEEDEEDLKDEWIEVALIVDRAMFYLFLFITLFSTLIILVIVPAISYTNNS